MICSERDEVWFDPESRALHHHLFQNLALLTSYLAVISQDLSLLHPTRRTLNGQKYNINAWKYYSLFPAKVVEGSTGQALTSILTTHHTKTYTCSCTNLCCRTTNTNLNLSKPVINKSNTNCVQHILKINTCVVLQIGQTPNTTAVNNQVSVLPLQLAVGCVCVFQFHKQHLFQLRYSIRRQCSSTLYGILSRITFLYCLHTSKNSCT